MSFPIDFPFYTIDSRIVKAVGVDNLRYITMLHENDRHVFNRLYFWEAKRGEFCIKGKRCLAAFPLLGYAILFRSMKVLKYILKQKPDLFQIGAILTDIDDDSGRGTIQKLEEHSGISLTHFLIQKEFYKDTLKLFNILLQEEVEILYRFELRDQRIKSSQMQSYDLFSFDNIFQFLKEGAKAKPEGSEKALHYVKAAEAMYKGAISYEEALKIAAEGLPIPIVESKQDAAIESKQEDSDNPSDRRSSKEIEDKSVALLPYKGQQEDHKKERRSSGRPTEKDTESGTKITQHNAEAHKGIESDKSKGRMLHHSETDPPQLKNDIQKLDSGSKREKSDPKKTGKAPHYKPLRRIESDSKKFVDNEAPKQRTERHKSEGDSVLQRDLKASLKESLKGKRVQRKSDGSTRRSDTSNKRSDPKLSGIDSEGGSKKMRRSGRKSGKDFKLPKQSAKLDVQDMLLKDESGSDSGSKHLENKNDFLEDNNDGERIEKNIGKTDEDSEVDIEKSIQEITEDNTTDKTEGESERNTEEKVDETTEEKMKEMTDEKTKESHQENEEDNI